MGVFYKEVSPDITKNRDPWKTIATENVSLMSYLCLIKMYDPP